MPFFKYIIIVSNLSIFAYECVQVLKQSHPYGRGEKILKKLLSRDSASLATVLKRLLYGGEKYGFSLEIVISALKV